MCYPAAYPADVEPHNLASAGDTGRDAGGEEPPAAFRAVLEALSRVNGWLAFVYPPQYAKQVQRLQKTSAYKRLPVVKANHVRTLGGTTWLFGGPRSTMLFADRVAAALS